MAGINLPTREGGGWVSRFEEMVIDSNGINPSETVLDFDDKGFCTLK